MNMYVYKIFITLFCFNDKVAIYFIHYFMFYICGI